MARLQLSPLLLALVTGIAVGGTAGWITCRTRALAIADLLVHTSDAARIRDNVRLLAQTDSDLRCLLARQTSARVADQEGAVDAVSETSMFGFGGAGVPAHTLQLMRQASDEYHASAVPDLASTCETKIKLYE